MLAHSIEKIRKHLRTFKSSPMVFRYACFERFFRFFFGGFSGGLASPAARFLPESSALEICFLVELAPDAVDLPALLSDERVGRSSSFKISSRL